MAKNVKSFNDIGKSLKNDQQNASISTVSKNDNVTNTGVRNIKKLTTVSNSLNALNTTQQNNTSTLFGDNTSSNVSNITSEDISNASDNLSKVNTKKSKALDSINTVSNIKEIASDKFNDIINSNVDSINNLGDTISNAISFDISGQLGDLLGNNGGPLLSTGDFSMETLTGLKNLAIDPALNFMSGELTSAFAPVDQIVGTSINTALAATNVVMNLPNIITELTTTTLQKLSTAIMDIVVNSTMTVLDTKPITEKITYFTTYYTQVGTRGAQDLLKDIMAKQDDELKTKFENDDERIKSEKLEKISKKLIDIKNKTSYIIEDAKYGVDLVVTYVNNGPDWVIKQLNSYTSFAIDQANMYVDYGVKYVTDLRDDYIEMAGEYVGTKLATFINDTVKKSLRKQLEKTYAETRKLIMQAMVAIMSAAQIVVSMVGPLLGKLVKVGVKMGMNALQKQLSSIGA